MPARLPGLRSAPRSCMAPATEREPSALRTALDLTLAFRFLSRVVLRFVSRVVPRFVLRVAFRLVLRVVPRFALRTLLWLELTTAPRLTEVRETLRTPDGPAPRKVVRLAA